MGDLYGKPQLGTIEKNRPLGRLRKEVCVWLVRLLGYGSFIYQSLVIKALRSLLPVGYPLT